MSDEEGKLAAYMTNLSVISRNFSLFAGFTFTAITILITRLSDPSTWQSQVMLFFLSALFYLLYSSLFDNQQLIGYCVKHAPKLPKDILKSADRRAWFIWLMLGSSLWLLFLLWNLLYLALATGIVFALFVITSYRKMNRLFKGFEDYQRISLHEVEN